MSTPLEDAFLPEDGIIVTQSLTVSDVIRSADYYSRVLGGAAVRNGQPSIVRLANTWLILNVGGGPTDDKPAVTLRPPADSTLQSGFLNIRTGDIASLYARWRARGAEFLTEPKDHPAEIRC